WKICFYARLRDGNHAASLIKYMLTPVEPTRYWGGPGGMYPNLFDAHPPFQIDGNFGLAAGISELIIQTDGENTLILPSLPDAWQNGYLKGVRIPGGAKADIYWKDGKLDKLDIKGNYTGKIMYNGTELSV
ncbi:MAG: glycoside hydrolase family 95 protein, partial [Clostridia bacterium]|nr:glycoside hydrolase family 95 protein [Clostridia bacterium]